MRIFNKYNSIASWNKKSVCIGDDRKGTPEILQERVDSVDKSIDTWQPDTAWESANQRSLRRLKTRRVKKEKALKRIANKEKETMMNKRKLNSVKRMSVEPQVSW